MTYNETINYLLSGNSKYSNYKYYQIGNIQNKKTIKNKQLYELCNEIYKFYNKQLNDYKKFKLSSKPFLVFVDSSDVNAEALQCPKNNYFVLIYIGLIEELQHFKNNNFVIGDINGLKYFSDLKKYVNNSNKNINDLLFEAALHFVFYHEFAHLLQYELSKKNTNGEFLFSKQIKEIDADIVSGFAIAQYFNIFYDKYFKYFGNDIIEDFFSIFIGSIVTFINSFPVNNFYTSYLDHNHPHNSIRSYCVTNSIIIHFGDIQNQKNNNLNLNYNKVYYWSFEIAKNLLLHFSKNSESISLENSISLRFNEIIEYYKQTINILDTYENSAIKMWNS